MSLLPDPACNGFVLSPEFIESQGLPFAERNEVVATKMMLHAGVELVMSAGGCQPRPLISFEPVPDPFDTALTEETGSYQMEGEDRMLLHTGPTQGEPAVVTVTLTAAQCISALRFDLQFRSDRDADAIGLLRVYLDGNLVHQVEQSMLGEELITSGAIFLRDIYQPGTHTITFALETLSGGSAGILLGNVELGLDPRPSFLPPVRQPNGDILLILTCLSPGRYYVVEWSADLVGWTAFADFEPTNPTHQLLVPAKIVTGHRFFRAVAP
jgi:hypothetical protein